MRRSGWIRVALMVAVGAACSLPALAQTEPEQINSGPRAEIGASYVADIANAHPGNCGCFALQGGGLNGAFQLNRHIWVAADVSVVHAGTVSGADYGLGLLTVLAGPQYKFHRGRNFVPYAQALFGFVHGFDSVFPGSSEDSANSFAFEAGGGAEFKLDRRFALRLVEVDYMRTELPNNVNGWQNHLKIASGIVYRF